MRVQVPLGALYAFVAQLVELLICNQVVVGSSPIESFAGVTQLVEYLVANQIVASSSLATRSIYAPVAQLDRASAF